MSNVIYMKDWLKKKEEKKYEHLSPDEKFSKACRLSDAYEDSEDAQRLYEEVIRARPDHWSAVINLGNVFFAQGKSVNAIAQWERALVLNSQATEASYNLGYIYFQQNQMKKALQYFKTSIDIDPNFADAHFNIAETYAFMKKNSLAKEHYKKYVEIAPEGPWSELARTRISR